MTRQSVTLFHNPRCSKSRATLSLLENANAAENRPALDIDVIRYLEEKPGAAIIRELADKLGRPVKDLVRTSDALFRELDIGEEALTDTRSIQLLVEYPALLQRPVVVVGDKAVIGRPPENIYSIL